LLRVKGIRLVVTPWVPRHRNAEFQEIAATFSAVGGSDAAASNTRHKNVGY
jgi:hypothetical protein